MFILKYSILSNIFSICQNVTYSTSLKYYIILDICLKKITYILKIVFNVLFHFQNLTILRLYIYIFIYSIYYTHFRHCYALFGILYLYFFELYVIFYFMLKTLRYHPYIFILYYTYFRHCQALFGILYPQNKLL